MFSQCNYFALFQKVLCRALFQATMRGQEKALQIEKAK